MGDIWKKGHIPCSLNGQSQFSLILSGNTGVFASQDTSMRIEEVPQELGILIVYMLYIVLIEVTLCHVYLKL